MPVAHRNSDIRTCGATTIVSNQSTVYVNGELWAVAGDPNSHGGGNLVNSGSTVFVEGANVIVNAPDSASPDGLCPIPGGNHCNPATSGGSPDVYSYGD
jgi:hypothetical protein